MLRREQCAIQQATDILAQIHRSPTPSQVNPSGKMWARSSSQWRDRTGFTPASLILAGFKYFVLT